MFKEVHAKSFNVVCKAIVFVVEHINNIQFCYFKWKKISYESKQHRPYTYYVYIILCLMNCQKKLDMVCDILYLCFKISHCNWLGDCLIEVEYNRISLLGILNGDHLHLIEVKLTINKGIDFWGFGNCPLHRGWLLNRGPLIEDWLYYYYYYYYYDRVTYRNNFFF